MLLLLIISLLCLGIMLAINGHRILQISELLRSIVGTEGQEPPDREGLTVKSYPNEEARSRPLMCQVNVDSNTLVFIFLLVGAAALVIAFASGSLLSRVEAIGEEVCQKLAGAAPSASDGPE